MPQQFSNYISLTPAYVAPWPPEGRFGVVVVNNTVDEQVREKVIHFDLNPDG